mmetsp:Transcript_6951/g.14514  ORF Transcript_6951/g.14514 Transcript_6951/m.14514 type:complete len:126 (-) Transcript_6951:1376-1753(-)
MNLTLRLVLSPLGQTLILRLALYPLATTHALPQVPAKPMVSIWVAAHDLRLSREKRRYFSNKQQQERTHKIEFRTPHACSLPLPRAVRNNQFSSDKRLQDSSRANYKPLPCLRFSTVFGYVGIDS